MSSKDVPMSRAAFERTRRGETNTPERAEKIDRPPRLVLPDPRPSYAQPSRHAEQLWFAETVPPELRASLNRDEFQKLRAPKPQLQRQRRLSRSNG